MPGCAMSFMLLCPQRKVWIQISKGMWTFYFPDCAAKFLYRHMIWIGGKGDYLYMVSTAGFSIILIIVIVHKVYEKWTKGVKFYLLFRFMDMFGRIRLLGGSLLGWPLCILALGTKSPCRLVLSFRRLWVFAGLSWVFLFQKGSLACKNKTKGYQSSVKAETDQKDRKIKLLPLAVCWRHKRDAT